MIPTAAKGPASRRQGGALVGPERAGQQEGKPPLGGAPGTSPSGRPLSVGALHSPALQTLARNAKRGTAPEPRHTAGTRVLGASLPDKGQMSHTVLDLTPLKNFLQRSVYHFWSKLVGSYREVRVTDTHPYDLMCRSYGLIPKNLSYLHFIFPPV